MIAFVWPAYHLNNIVLRAASIPSAGSLTVHVIFLLAVTLLFGLLSAKPPQNRRVTTFQESTCQASARQLHSRTKH
jgi:uncharacterized protein (DUF58 family)